MPERSYPDKPLVFCILHPTFPFGSLPAIVPWIVGTRNDLAEALQFAAEGKVASRYATERLDDINAIFSRMEAGKINGRIVMEI